MNIIEESVNKLLNFDLNRILASDFIQNTVLNALFVVLVFVIAGIVIKAINKIILKKLLEGKALKLSRFSERIMERVVKYIVLLFALFFILQSFKIDVTGVIALLGVGGIAVALAAQETLANVIAGFILLTDKPFKVGDRIALGGEEERMGDVYDIGLRSTRINTLDNVMVTIPNAELTKRDIYNFTLRDRSLRLELPITISYESYYEKAEEAIFKALNDSPYVMNEKNNKIQLREFADHGIKLAVRAWIAEAKDKRDAESDVLKRIKAEFEKAGIEIPYPRTKILFNKGELSELNERK